MLKRKRKKKSERTCKFTPGRQNRTFLPKLLAFLSRPGCSALCDMVSYRASTNFAQNRNPKNRTNRHTDRVYSTFSVKVWRRLLSMSLRGAEQLILGLSFSPPFFPRRGTLECRYRTWQIAHCPILGIRGSTGATCLSTVSTVLVLGKPGHGVL